MKLELKHLAPYLPYGLRMQYFDDERGSMTVCNIAELRIDEMTITDSQNEYEVLFYETRPILRPMVDFEDPKKYNGDHYSFMSELNSEMPNDLQIGRDLEFDIERNCFVHYKYAMQVYDFLFANNFDVFGLIDKGLAIDINTIETP